MREPSTETVVRVAYIEDEESKALVARTFLDPAAGVPGYALTVLAFDEAFREHEADRRRWSDNFDVVLLDLGEKTGKNLHYASTGFELAAKIKESDGPPMAVVTYSPASEDVVAQCKQVGISHGIFGKLPSRADELARLIDETLGDGPSAPVPTVVVQHGKMTLQRWSDRAVFRKAFDAALDGIVQTMIREATRSVDADGDEDLFDAVKAAAQAEYDTDTFRWAVVHAEPFPWATSDRAATKLIKDANRALCELLGNHWNKEGSVAKPGKYMRQEDTQVVVSSMWREPEEVRNLTARRQTWRTPWVLADEVRLSR